MWLIGAVVCLLAAPRVQRFAIAGSEWAHMPLRCNLMPVCYHFRDCKRFRPRVSLTISTTGLYLYCVFIFLMWELDPDLVTWFYV